jgi:putative ubiquitin-RnfH superfamily antitoxin RatB of RatAB toxin-antitoxin module
MASAEAASVHVEVACSPAAGQVVCRLLVLQPGATVRQAIAQCGLPWSAESEAASPLKIGVWGQLRSLDHVLRDGDRVEIYRALLIDPMDARRVRHRGQKTPKR